MVLAAGLGIGLFTGVGTHPGSPEGGSRPVIGSQAPEFSLAGLDGGRVTDAAGHGRPVALLFFGNWCAACHGEVPVLARAVRHQQTTAGDPLGRVEVIGVDSFDSARAARSFATQSRISFAVGLDPEVAVTNGLYYFTGDPYAVFIDGRGRITAIHPGPLSAATFESLEQGALVH